MQSIVTTFISIHCMTTNITESSRYIQKAPPTKKRTQRLELEPISQHISASSSSSYSPVSGFIMFSPPKGLHLTFQFPINFQGKSVHKPGWVAILLQLKLYHSSSDFQCWDHRLCNGEADVSFWWLFNLERLLRVAEGVHKPEWSSANGIGWCPGTELYILLTSDPYSHAHSSSASYNPHLHS